MPPKNKKVETEERIVLPPPEPEALPELPPEPEPVAVAAPEPAPAPPADVAVRHVPCGTILKPGDEGLAFAARAGQYVCARCGGKFPNRTFQWTDGRSFP